MKINQRLIQRIYCMSEKELKFIEELIPNNEIKNMSCGPTINCDTCLVNIIKEILVFNDFVLFGSSCYQTYNMIIEHIEYLKAETLSEKLAKNQ